MRKWNSMREGLEQGLAILVEWQLYATIKEIRKGHFPNEKEMIQEAITSFENGLPQNLKQIPNYHSVVMEVLAQMNKDNGIQKKASRDDEQER